MLKKLISSLVAFVLMFSCMSPMVSAATSVTNEIEPNDDFSFSQEIESDCSITGSLFAPDLDADEPVLDIDTFKFTLTERSKVTLTLSSDSEFLIPIIADETGENMYMPDIDEMMEELPEEYVISEFLKKGTYYIVLSNLLADGETNYTFNITWESAVETLRKEDGVWKYYVGETFSPETTLVKFNGVWFYVENGIWNKTADTLVKYEDMWFYVKNGKWTSKPNTLIKYKGQWFYIKNGKWDKEAQTLVKYKGKWFYVKNGKWNKSTTIVNYKSKKFYVKGGFAQLDFSGKRKIGDQTFIIKNGKVV